MANRLRISHEEVHHLEQVERTLREVKELLEQGGKINHHALLRKLEVYGSNPLECALDGITGRNDG